jgi:hypothetical protein
MAIRLESQLDSWPGMAICTRGPGPRRVWHPSGAGLEIDPWVHPNPPRDQDGCGCQFAPTGAHRARQPKTHLIEFLTFLPKPAGTRNLPGAGAV